MTQLYNRSLVSPLLDRTFNHENNRDHYLPKDVHGAASKERYLPYSHEGHGRKGAQPISPMSDHRDGLYDRPDTSNHKPPPREQLPSLSSLFPVAATTGQSRPAQSPYSDRNSPVFPSGSPGEPRHPATPIHPDRHFDSYLQQHQQQRPAIPRPYSQGTVRPEGAEKQSIAPPPRPTALGLRPDSPRYEVKGTSLEEARTPTSAHGGWSPHSQSNRSEYFSRDPAAFRPKLEHHAAQLPIHQTRPEARPVYRSTTSTTSFPPTPASTVAGDVTTSKDGLGPKIWTGTQFLPRFVRQAEIPGEGVCYFYDDGTHCKTVIDGEVVNAHWGVTKAGKPRKRLAIACITCREKKIKCDPDYPRCVQCEKFGRICKFKNAPRGGQGSPGTQAADHEDVGAHSVSSRTDAESLRSERVGVSRSVSPRQALRAGTPDLESHHAKRQRTAYSEFTPVGSEASPVSSVRSIASPALSWAGPLGPAAPPAAPADGNLSRAWLTNPYATQPALVTELINAYFKHVPETAYCIFPEGPFKNWVLSHAEKSADDLMVIYTVLALGTVFSLKAEYKPLGAQYAAISRFACDTRHFSLQLVQSRLLLALYYFAVSKPADAWDFCGGALRTMSGLKLNLEIEQTDDAFLQTFPYGLTRNGYAECRRRTFWSCYNMDRFNGLCTGNLAFVHPEDIFVRLPCDLKLFESQADVQAPFFDAKNPIPQSASWALGPAAYLTAISTIWGEVMANVYRTAQRSTPLTSNASFLEFYDSIGRRLQAWKDSLPQPYTFSPTNLKIAGDSGKLGTYITMHAVYHTTAIKLHRYVQKSIFTPLQLSHNISQAKHHADCILSMMDALAASRTAPTSPLDPETTPRKFSSGFVGYAIVGAIDVASARVPPQAASEVLQSFRSAQTVLDELALFWQSGRNQHLMISTRLHDLRELATATAAEAAGFKFGLWRDGNFQMSHPIEKIIPREFDCLYT